MRSAIFGLFALVFILLTVAPAGAEIYGRTGFHLDWWDSENGAKGFQYHIPIEAGGNIGPFSYKVLTAYAYNDIEPRNAPSFDFNGLVDARVNMAYEIIDRLPFDLLLAVDLNLPTGKTKLSDAEFRSILDPDKVTITRMGEGFNINPSLIALKQWNALLASIGIGYIWRGEYDATDALTDYDPGDALNLTAEVDYNFSARWIGRLFGSYSRFNEDELADQEFFEPGDVRIFGGGITYARARWDLSASIKAILRDKDRRQVGGAMVTDADSYYGDEWVYRLSGNYQLADRWSLGAWVQYLTIASNDFPPDALFNNNFVSRREKILLGAELVLRPAPGWAAGLKLQAYRMDVKDNPLYTAVIDGGFINDVYDVNKDFAGGAAAIWISAAF